MLRTHTCGELRKKDIGKKAKLCGWVDTVRSYGKLHFIDIRDRYGKTQVVVKGKLDVKPEYCICVSGKVNARKKGTEKKDLETGDIEIFADDLNILNKSPPMPFEINDVGVGDEVSSKYRYLALRGDKLQGNLILRHNVSMAIRDYMNKAGFVNVETPILGKSTPEGARDYIVPSRVNKGKFYALPQSPQLLKQLLMISGMDKYYQIARCFRDEDLRADRQPEFTQLDVEMSFVEPDDIISEMEKMMKHVFKEVLGENLNIPFPRMTYSDAMKKHKRDNPDVRKKGEKFAFVWVTEFPMFEYNDEDKRLYATHHPFTMPSGDVNEKAKSEAYDLVLNGTEIGGGSIRIHNPEIQKKVFDVLGISKKEANDKFGFLIDALSHGAPPHGGIAFGLDRLCAIMVGSDSIRDVIAFPKNKAAQDIMLDAPGDISNEQLKEANIKLDVKKKK